LLRKSDDAFVIWIDDSRESGTVNASEVRWLSYDDLNNTFVVQFVDFPEDWSESMLETADIECDQSTNYEFLLETLETSQLIGEFDLVDGMQSCSIWTDVLDPLLATRVSIRFTLATSFGPSSNAIVDESIRQHLPPQEQQ
jgi:hypothetical protein